MVPSARTVHRHTHASRHQRLPRSTHDNRFDAIQSRTRYLIVDTRRYTQTRPDSRGAIPDAPTFHPPASYPLYPSPHTPTAPDPLLLFSPRSLEQHLRNEAVQLAASLLGRAAYRTTKLPVHRTCFYMFRPFPATGFDSSLRRPIADCDVLRECNPRVWVLVAGLQGII